MKPGRKPISKNGKNRKRMLFSLDEDTANLFLSYTKTNKVNMSSLIEKFMRDYNKKETKKLIKGEDSK